jgi:membrane protease YdiL (CAAX protease family)
LTPLADSSRALTSPRISLANILGLFVGGVIVSIVAFVLVLLFGGSLLLAYLVSEGASSAWWVAGYYRRSRRLGWESLRTRFAVIDRKLMLASVAGALALNVFPDAAIWILRGAGIKVADIPADALVPSGSEQLPLTVLFLVILAPFAEELIFRGLLLDWLKQNLAAWQAILISSLIFALLHDNHLMMGPAGWIELLDRVLMGVGASILALQSRSLRGPFVMHAANNMIVCITSALDF